MTGFASILRGDGLARVLRALDGLEADSLRLDDARTRFSQPPPSYTSNPSGTTTRSASPEPSSDEQQRRDQREQKFQRRRKLMDERAASLPLQQFQAQKDEETRRLWNTNPRTNWMSESKIPIGGIEEKEAIEMVKKRRVEQGIWKDKWEEMAAGRNYMNVGRWKHEEPIELESESETEAEAKSSPIFSMFGPPPKPPQPKPRRLKSDDEILRIAERRAVLEREREASRPYYQFVYQISKERERIQGESAHGEGSGTADINTRAYENVRNTWIKRSIWNESWGILPGMLWKHEEPLEEDTADDPIPIPCLDVDSTRLRNGNAKPSPSPSNPFHPDGQTHSVANISLSPAHPSKVSKVLGKEKPKPRKRPNSQMVSSNGSTLSFGEDEAEPQPSPDRTTPTQKQKDKTSWPYRSQGCGQDEFFGP